MECLDGKLDSSLFEVRRVNGFPIVTLRGERSPDSASAPAAQGRTPPSRVPAPANAGAGGGDAGDAAAVVADPGPPQYVPSSLSLDERVALAMSVGEECVTPEELRNLLAKKPFPVCYDGFEPSGRMHIAQGILKAINVNKLTTAGCVFKFWVADWFALMNNKLGGDLKKIRKVGEYMIEVWKAAGMDMRNVEFLWASEEINRNPDAYWMRVLDIARRFNLPRIKRCCSIMGRSEGDDLAASQIFYPCMQCADIFNLKADICQLGMDQRKVNMLAREYCDTTKPRIKLKPIILSHPMMMGLKQGQEKMSKSDPDSAIFMEDSVADVRRKIRQAYCPPGEVEGNPCLNWMQHIVFGKFGSVEISRDEAHGGNVVYEAFEQMTADYASGALHPGDLKQALTRYLNEALEPVRQHFQSGRPAQLLKEIRKYRISR